MQVLLEQVRSFFTLELIMATSTSTFGLTIGRALGRTAATAVHAGAVAATYTGNFGKDVATGSVEAYAEHSLRLAAQREAAKAARTFAPIAAPRPTRSIKVARATA